MTLQIDPDKARERIDEFLDEIDELLDKPYREGEEEKRTLSTKLDNFAEVAFSDGEKKKQKLHPSVRTATVGGKSDAKKQKEYEDSLKRKKRHLEAWKEQIELEESTNSGNSGDPNGEYDEIKQEISKIEAELPIYADDLNESIDELEKGHYLASAMIAGRVIDHTIDQIKSSQKLGGPEEVLDYLQEDGIIDSKETNITESIKMYRDMYAHEIGESPDFTEALLILLGCAKLLHSIQDADKAREYDLA